MFSVEKTPRYNTIDKEYWQSDHTNWWYHRPRERGSQGITPSWLLKNVDPEISGIIKLFLEYKIPTTPSSAGKIIGREDISMIWESLLKDSWDIKKKGLILQGQRQASSIPKFSRYAFLITPMTAIMPLLLILPLTIIV